HELRMAVEVLGAVDECQMADAVDALHGARYDLGIADVAAHELARAPDAGEAAVISTRVVVEDAHAVPFAEQALDERASEEAGSARNQVGFLCHRFTRAASGTSDDVRTATGRESLFAA